MRYLRIFAIVAVTALSAWSVQAKDDPVQWGLSPAKGFERVQPGGSVWLEFTATVEPGWHLYSPTTPPGGPIVSKIQVVQNPAISDVKIFRPQPVRKNDPNFQIDTETYSDKAVFLLEAQTAAGHTGPVTIEATAYYQTCSDVKCLRPVRKTASTVIAFDAAASISKFSPPAGYVQVQAPAVYSASSAAAAALPVAAGAAATGGALNTQQDLIPFLLTAFLFGLAAIFTPCVFPMIPITVSFFLNQGREGDEAFGRLEAGHRFLSRHHCSVHWPGILVTALTGPFGVVQLGSSPWVNGFIALVFLVFGLSLLGAFELRLPSGLLTRLNRASQGGGYAGTLLMGLTFALTSFACIGPIVGPLLVASVQTKGAQPVLGMASFATGLALPFFGLALFPAYLENCPAAAAGWRG